jgi:hypothetical protein
MAEQDKKNIEDIARKSPFPIMQGMPNSKLSKLHDSCSHRQIDWDIKKEELASRTNAIPPILF